MTLDDFKVRRLLLERFVTTYHDYGAFPGESPDYPRVGSGARDPNVPDGYGADQIALYICDPQGRVLHQLRGHHGPATFARELHWALSLFATTQALGRDWRRGLHASVAERVAETRDENLMRFVSARIVGEQVEPFLLRIRSDLAGTRGPTP